LPQNAPEKKQFKENVNVSFFETQKTTHALVYSALAYLRVTLNNASDKRAIGLSD